MIDWTCGECQYYTGEECNGYLYEGAERYEHSDACEDFEPLEESQAEMDKWQWMMDYCKANNLPPAQKWAWDKAEEAYKEVNDASTD